MSGIFWEPDTQPDLCEAVSGYTLSTVTLALAIPMAIVDLLCSTIIFITSLIMAIVNPGLDYVLHGGASILELLGIETWTQNTTIISLLLVYHVAVLLTTKVGSGSFYQKVFSRINFNIMSIIWLVSFLSFPVFENAVFAQVALLSIALQGAEGAVNILFLEYNNFASEPKENALNSIATGVLACLRMEVFAALIVSAFGYPSFTQEDDITQYFCIAPIIATQIIYFTSVRQTEAEPANTAHANGTATAVKDSPAEETILETNLKVQEVEESVIDEIAPEEITDATKEDEPLTEGDSPNNEGNQKEEDALKDDETPKQGIASEIVAAVETAATVADVVQKKVGEVKDVVEEIVEEITEEVNEKIKEATDETAQIIKEDALFKRIQNCIVNISNTVQSQMMRLTQPIINLMSNLLATVTSLPWTTILLFTFSTSSHFLWSYAWLHLTGNPLAYSLPVLTLLLPSLLPKLPLLPSQAKFCIEELASLATAAVQYSLITSVETDE